MRGTVHAVAGLTLGFMFYLMSDVSLNMNLSQLALYVVFLPYFYLKIADILSLVETRRLGESFVEGLKVTTLYLLLFIAPRYLLQEKYPLIAEFEVVFLNFLDYLFSNIVSLGLVLTLEYSIIFSMFQDRKNGRNRFLHSLFFPVLFFVFNVYLLGYFLNPLLTMLISNIFLTCGLIHLGLDAISVEGFYPLYPLSRKAVIKDYIKEKSIIRKSEKVLSALFYFINILILIPMLGAIFGIREASILYRLPSPQEILSIYVLTILLPLPLIFYYGSKVDKRDVVLVPRRCPNCNRIVPRSSIKCPYCGFIVRRGEK